MEKYVIDCVNGIDLVVEQKLDNQVIFAVEAECVSRKV